MDTQTANICRFLAEAFRYPAPGHLAALDKGLQALPASGEKGYLTAFLNKVKQMTLGEWEELHTRTLDLNPPAAPYVGFQTWGETYPRGAFLSRLSRALAEEGIDLEGELPDHLAPVLRYLGQANHPLPELVELLAPALRRMRTALGAKDPDNPYLDLLEAAQAACAGLKKEAA